MTAKAQTGPICVFGELIPDRILARASEDLLQESQEHGDYADCARYVVECAAHHVRYPDSVQSFGSVEDLSDFFDRADFTREFPDGPLKPLR